MKVFRYARAVVGSAAGLGGAFGVRPLLRNSSATPSHIGPTPQALVVEDRKGMGQSVHMFGLPVVVKLQLSCATRKFGDMG